MKIFFLKQITLKVDVNRWRNNKLPIFYESLLCKIIKIYENPINFPPEAL